MERIRIGRRVIRTGTVVCIGKNYADHLREMGDDGRPAEPVIFIKPPVAVRVDPGRVSIPRSLGLLHHEVELCLLLGGGGRDLGPEAAAGLVAAWAVGLDLTLRDRQAAAKARGEPWTLAKGFDGSAVFGRFAEARPGTDPLDAPIGLAVNDAPRQSGRTSSMLIDPFAIVSFVSRFFTLSAGDIVMTGTPAGVGPLGDGDRIEASVGGLPPLSLSIERP